MKTIGLIGGMSWESSLEYYRLINQEVKVRLGGLHSARCVMVSVDFAPIEALQAAGEWEEAGRVLAEEARACERAGAACIVLCTNTMHRVFDAIQSAVDVPLIHIADATAAKMHEAGVGRVGLLGTRFTMEHDFYKGRLSGFDVLIPEEPARTRVHDIIYQELVLGQINEASRDEYRRIMGGLMERGAEGIILGCTEIPLLVKPEDASVPLFDTTLLHAQAAVDFALSGSAG